MTGRCKNPTPRMLSKYGCSAEFWLQMRDIGIAMVAGGASGDVTPLRAYLHQKHAALNRRKISWKMTLPEWWGIWDSSGKWGQRGKGRGYMMCRVGDVGAYEVGNVYIGEGAHNLSQAAKKLDLPIGVSRTTRSRHKPFRAYCNVGGRQIHLGTFASASEAEAAYLAARDADMASRQVAA